MVCVACLLLLLPFDRRAGDKILKIKYDCIVLFRGIGLIKTICYQRWICMENVFKNSHSCESIARANADECAVIEKD